MLSLAFRSAAASLGEAASWPATVRKQCPPLSVLPLGKLGLRLVWLLVSAVVVTALVHLPSHEVVTFCRVLRLTLILGFPCV